MNKLSRFCFIFLLIISGAWLWKSYLFSIYYIPSDSMSPTLNPGDYVLVSKYPYNLRSPEYYPLTAVPFPFFAADGFSSVQQDDILVFDMPMVPAELHPAQKEDYIKRCMGLPGDTVAVNKDRYFLKRKGQKNTSQVSKDSSAVVLTIPEKGKWIQLSDSIGPFWESIVLRDDNTFTRDQSGNILINGKPRKEYQVKQNYYFVQGDNTRFSSDSHSWGLVPKSYLIGRAELKIWPWPPKWLE